MLAGIAILFLFSLPQNRSPRAVGADSGEPIKTASLTLIWKRNIEIPLSMTSSPDGKFIVTVDPAGSLKCFGEDGTLAWEISLPGVDKAAVGPDGTTVAYSSLNPINNHVYFVSPDGNVLWKQKVSGAVWCAAASNEPGRFAVGTGERYCYVYTISEHRHRYRRWRVPGVPCSVTFRQDGNSLVFGTWQEAGVCEYTPNGKRITWRPGKGDRLHSVDICTTGDIAVVVARPNRNIPEASLQIKDKKLENLWSREFTAYDLVADAAPSGKYVAVGYRRVIEHKDKEMIENRIALLDRKGRILWEKGGMFGEWNLLEVCPSGNLIVYDDSPHIYILDNSGKVLMRRKLPAEVRSFATTSKRNRIIISCEDGQLCAFSLDLR